MTTYYLRSTDGDNASSGVGGWANAKATLAGVFAVCAAGDTILVSPSHLESTSVPVDLVCPGTVVNPCRILCCDDTGDPETPTALATGAIVRSNASNRLSLSGSFYSYGVSYQVHNGGSQESLYLCSGASDAVQVFEQTAFKNTLTSAGGRIAMGSGSVTSSKRCEWIECTAEFGHTQQGVSVTNVFFLWRGGSVVGAITPADYLFSSLGHSQGGGRVLIEGVDLSALGSGAGMVNVSQMDNGATLLARQFKGWTNIIPTAGTWQGPGTRIELWEYTQGAAGTDITQMRVEDYCGQSYEEYARVRDGTLSIQDGFPFSWYVQSNANAAYPWKGFESEEAPVEITAAMVGNTVTLDIHFLHDSATLLTNADIYPLVQYPGGASGQATLISGRAGALATPANHAASSATWNTVGMAAPNAQKMTVSFSPARAGVAIMRFVLCKPSKIVYVDPDCAITIS